MSADDTLGCNLATHEGRLAFIRAARDFIPPALLAEARARDPFPVLWLHPGPAARSSTRKQVLDWLRSGYNPELVSLLSRDDHPRGTVFFMVAHDRQHSFLQSIVQLVGQG